MKLSFKLLAVLVSASFCLQQASEATITVINNNDSGLGSLREAISASYSGDTIDFDSSLNGQTITLTSGELFIRFKNLTISGPSANLLVINGNAAGRVFHITSLSDVTISGLTITNGATTGYGGGIYNEKSMLTITNCTLSGNSADYGGGIYNDGHDFDWTTTITNCTLSGNSATSDGGGIYSFDWTTTITNCTLSGNSAAARGGAIYNRVFNNRKASLEIFSSTLSGNSARWAGGIVHSASPRSGMAIIGNTILKGQENIVSLGGSFSSGGYNLSNDNGGGFLTRTGDQINTDPLLGPLQDNGGPTWTHALLVDSPAIDKGKNFTATTDQRGSGYARTVDNPSITNATGGDGTDIVSFEVQAPTSTPPRTTTPRLRPTPAPRPSP
jgi:parallel beta-helix repeat protein